MANWRKTKYPGVYVAHSKSCPAYAETGARCRCKPSWRGRAWDSSAKKAVWSRSSKSRGESLAWLAAMSKGSDHLAELAKVGPTFEMVGERWLDGVQAFFRLCGVGHRAHHWCSIEFRARNAQLGVRL